MPCTRWIRPAVWRVAWPADIVRAVQEGRLTMVDCEYAAYFIQECLLDFLLLGEVAGMFSFVWSDNSPTVGIVQRQASRAQSPMPQMTLLWLALRQRLTRRGPQDIEHWFGEGNKMADFPSRSFEEQFVRQGMLDDAKFLVEFSHHFPLPEPFQSQRISWQSVQPPSAVVSAAISLLRGQSKLSTLEITRTGESGVSLPPIMANTLYSLRGKTTISNWNDSGCSWPLLLPCGTENTALLTSRYAARQSRRRYEKSPQSWNSTTLSTLTDRILPNGISTRSSNPTSTNSRKSTRRLSLS